MMTVETAGAPLRFELSGDTGLSFDLGGESAIKFEIRSPTYIDVDVYDGGYVFTPAEEEQVIQTTAKTLAQDIIINPIPSNYGRISWDGRRLKVE